MRRQSRALAADPPAVSDRCNIKYSVEPKSLAAAVDDSGAVA